MGGRGARDPVAGLATDPGAACANWAERHRYVDDGLAGAAVPGRRGAGVQRLSGDVSVRPRRRHRRGAHGVAGPWRAPAAPGPPRGAASRLGGVYRRRAGQSVPLASAAIPAAVGTGTRHRRGRGRLYARTGVGAGARALARGAAPDHCRHGQTARHSAGGIGRFVPQRAGKLRADVRPFRLSRAGPGGRRDQHGNRQMSV